MGSSISANVFQFIVPVETLISIDKITVDFSGTYGVIVYNPGLFICLGNPLSLSLGDFILTATAGGAAIEVLEASSLFTACFFTIADNTHLIMCGFYQ